MTDLERLLNDANCASSAVRTALNMIDDITAEEDDALAMREKVDLLYQAATAKLDDMQTSIERALSMAHAEAKPAPVVAAKVARRRK